MTRSKRNPKGIAPFKDKTNLVSHTHSSGENETMKRYALRNSAPVQDVCISQEQLKKENCKSASGTKKGIGQRKKLPKGVKNCATDENGKSPSSNNVSKEEETIQLNQVTNKIPPKQSKTRVASKTVKTVVEKQNQNSSSSEVKIPRNGLHNKEVEDKILFAEKPCKSVKDPGRVASETGRSKSQAKPPIDTLDMKTSKCKESDVSAEIAAKESQKPERKVTKAVAQKQFHKDDVTEHTNRVLRNMKPVNYNVQSSQSDASLKENLDNESTKSEHIPVYRRKLICSPKPHKKTIDVYEFFSDEKEKKRRRRKSDPSFKVKLPKKKKVTWVSKAKETLERLGLNVSSKTLCRDVEDLIQAKVLLKQKNISGDKITPPDNSTGVELMHGDSNSALSPQEKKKIDIISQVIIPPPPEFSNGKVSPNTSNESLDMSQLPIANSTMINNEQRAPWRPSLPVKHNPHFVKVKSNALPSVDQEIVLDASFSKGALNSTPKPKSTSLKNFAQQSIMNYVSNKEDAQDNCNSSLFNIDEYSPFKTQATQTNLNDPMGTHAVNKNGNMNDKVKRDIFKNIGNTIGSVIEPQETNRYNIIKKPRLEDIAVRGSQGNEKTEKELQSNMQAKSEKSGSISDHFSFNSTKEDALIAARTNNSDHDSTGNSVVRLDNTQKQNDENNKHVLSDEYSKFNKNARRSKRKTHQQRRDDKENIPSNDSTRKNKKTNNEAKSSVDNNLDSLLNHGDTEDHVLSKSWGRSSPGKNEDKLTRVPFVNVVNILKATDHEKYTLIDEYRKYNINSNMMEEKSCEIAKNCSNLENGSSINSRGIEIDSKVVDGVHNYFGFASIDQEADAESSNVAAFESPKTKCMQPKRNTMEQLKASSNSAEMANTNKGNSTRIPVVLLTNIVKQVDQNNKLVFVNAFSGYNGRFENGNAAIKKPQENANTHHKRTRKRLGASQKLPGSTNVEEGKPTRIPVVLLANIVKRIDKNELIFEEEFSKYNGRFEVDKTKNMSDSESEVDHSVEEEEEKNLEVPLFMDLEPLKPKKRYHRKAKIQPRRQSLASEDEASNYKKMLHKTKKPKMEWNEEAEKWAQQFNSLCKEVEDYELEVE